jgi:flagellar assembly factor FliW
MPLGVWGFERIKRYEIYSRAGQEPFQWFQMPGEESVGFLVVSPFAVMPDYRPALDPEDVEYLGLKSPEEAMFYNIVTLRGAGRATINLKGPVVAHRTTHIAKQVLLTNASDYSVHHPVPGAV